MIKYIIIFLSATLVEMLVVQSLASAYFYKLININNEISSHRMMEIRAFPEDLRCGIVRYWIKKNVPANGAVLVVGDSQSFGFNAQSSKIFSFLLAEYDRFSVRIVKNMSIIDGHFDDTRNELNIIHSNNIRFKSVIINVDPAHFKREYIVPRHLQSYQYGELSLRDVFFNKDLLASMKTLAIMNVITNSDVQAPWLLKDQDAEQSSPEIMNGPLPDDYISDQNNIKYEDDFISVLQSAKTVSDKIVVYMSPMQLYKKLPNAQKKIRTRYMELCERFSRANVGTVCLDPSDKFEQKDFVDIVHLSSTGHSKMADLLLPIIED